MTTTRAWLACLALACACSGTPAGQRPTMQAPVVDPPSGAVIGPQATLRLRFAESMNGDSLRVSGTLSSTAVPSWSETVVQSDTLTLQPPAASGWNAGAGTVVVDVVSAGGAAIETLSLRYTVDATTPSGGAQPASGGRLRPATPVVIRFSESMQPTTLALGGALGPLAQASWSQTATANDTVTLAPLSAWPEGAGQTLTVDAVDLSGAALARLSLSYVVDGTGPTATVSPISGSAIRPAQVIQLTFDEEMTADSITLGGSMAASAATSWQSGTALRVNPGPLWTEGGGTLEVKAADLAGNEVVTSLSFVVDGTSPAIVSVSPGDALITDPRGEITLRFDEAMEPSSLSLGANAPSGLSPQWTSTSMSNDTVRIPAPASGWMDGDAVRVTANDIAGNAAPVAAFDTRVSLIPNAPLLSIPLQAVRVANDDGSKRCRITPEEVALWVAEANRVFARANMRLVYDPARDFADERSTLLNQMTGVSDPQWAEEVAAGNAVAARYPGRLTVLLRWGPGTNPTGGGFSWTDYNFAAMPGFNDTFVCGHQNIQLFAHELGHQLGLAHTFAKIYGSVTQASADYAGDAAIYDGDGLWDTPADPYVSTSAVQCDRNLRVLDVGGVPQLIPRDNIMSYYDSRQMGLSALQALKIRQGALVRIGGDIRQILPGNFLAPFEGEALVAGASATTGSAVVQGDMKPFLGRWTGNAQLFWIGGSGASLTLSLSVAQAGVYRVFATFTHAPDFGIHQVYIGGEQAGESVNLYAKSVGHLPPLDLGLHALRSGTNAVKIVVQGRDTRSSGYALGIDYLLLQAQ